MPITYQIDERLSLVRVKGTGTVTCDDVLRHMDELRADPAYRAPMKKLIDYRELERLQISYEEAHFISDRKTALDGAFKGERCALVSPGDAVFGSSRVHQALVDQTDVDTAVFRDISEALDWLGVGEE